MGKVTHKRHSAEFKARVALKPIKGEQTLAGFGSKHDIHLTIVAAWKKAATEGMVARLHATIGQFIMAREFLAKASGR